MKPIYEEVTTDNNNKFIKKTDVDGIEYWIPCVESNSDYQAYLNKDKAEQSTPILPE
jgi:hypothetical protein